MTLPKVVVDECVNNLREALEKAVPELTGRIHKVARLMNEEPGHVPSFDIPETLQRYRTHLYASVKSRGGSVIDYPAVSHEDVVARALSRRKPFTPAGNVGYRDALIWHTVLAILHDSKDGVALITENTSDFANKDGKLHDDLVADLLADKIDPERLVLYTALKDFVDERIKPHLESLEETLDAFAMGKYPFDLEEAIGLGFQDAYLGTEADLEYFHLPSEYGSLNLGYVQKVRDIQVTSVTRLAGDEIWVNLYLNLDVEIDVIIRKSDIHTVDDPKLVISNWNSSDHVVSGSRVFGLWADVDLTYSVEDKKVTSIAFNDFGPEEEHND